MGRRDYERLEIEPFGRHLITTGDLDPVYIALTSLPDWSTGQLRRWLVAYWCLYHCGAACYASQHKGNDFWQVLWKAAINNEENPPPTGERWPRGHERRHFRGTAAVKAVTQLRKRYDGSPENMVSAIIGGTRPTKHIPFRDIAERTKDHPLFGPWIAFKVGDMIDRVLAVPVDFDQAHIFMFNDPAKAALMLWRQKMGLAENAMPKDKDHVIGEIVKHLEQAFSDLKAPPLGDRAIGLQEVETVLCKWKSHMNGHYPLFNDIDEIREGLEGWGQAALEFEAVMPEGSGA